MVMEKDEVAVAMKEVEVVAAAIEAVGGSDQICLRSCSTSLHRSEPMVVCCSARR